MGDSYFERRYRQLRAILAASVVGIVVQGVLWFALPLKGVTDAWTRWPFFLAIATFAFTVYDLFMPALEITAAIKEGRTIPAPPEREKIDRVFHSSVAYWVLGLALLLLSVVRHMLHPS